MKEKIDFETAYKTAKTLKKNIDNCTEYSNGFVFGCSDDENYIGGCGHTPCVILKENGEAVSMPVFVMKGTGEEIRTFSLK